MTISPRRTAATLLTASALALPLAAAAPTAAHADTECRITGFSPTTIEVGLSPKAVTFQPKVSGCSLKHWYIEGEDFIAFDNAKQWVFAPYDNAETAPHDVVVSAVNADYEEEIRVFDNAFRLKRNTTWDQFNASPEPVRKGAKITMKGRLRVADWTNDEYDGYANRNIDVEFKSKTGSTYQRVKTVTSGSGGYVSTTVTASADGTWRLRYGGNSTAGGGTTAGDFVDVR